MIHLITVFVFLATLTVALALAAAAGAFTGETEKRIRRRLRRLAAAAGPRTENAAVASLRRSVRDSAIPALDRLVKRLLPRPEALRRRLAQTGVRVGAGEYLLGSAVLAVVAGTGSRELLGASAALSVLAAIAVGTALPHMVTNVLIARRLKAFTTRFPEAIDLIVRGLKSGLPVPASMQAVTEELGDPVAGLFRIVTDRLRIGQSLDDALRDAAGFMPTAEFRFFVVSLAVQRETGGNLADTLANLSDILRKRRQVRLKIKAMSAEAKASALILGALPFLLLAVLMAVNPGYAGTLFHDPRGIAMAAAGLSSLAIGVLVMARMVRFEI